MSSSILDVACRAGVSKSTVSRVLNGGSVSSQTHAAVMAAIQELGYYPNAAARSLATKVTRTVGIVVSDVADSYYSEIIRGIEQCASQNGFDLLLCSSQQDEFREMNFVRKLLEKQVDGLLVVSCSSVKAQDALASFVAESGHEKPMVILERTLYSSRIGTVDIDNIGAAEMAVNHLIRLGYERIAHICGPPLTPWGLSRRKGYERALVSSGLPLDEELVLVGSFTYEGGYEAAMRLFRLSRPPQAIFVANDLSALGAWKAAREMRYSVPDDIALVGFDDIEVLEVAEIPLTTVRQPRRRMGLTAMNMLLSMMENGVTDEGQTLLLPTELVIRDSCGYKSVSNLRGVKTV